MELIPRKEPQRISCKQYQEYSPEKLEMYENNVFCDEQQRLNMLNLLMANVGIEAMVKNLPMETRKMLLDTLEEVEMERRCLEIIEQEILKFGNSRYSKVEHEHKFDKKNNNLFIFFRVINTGSIWFISYKFYKGSKGSGEFRERECFQAFECEDALRRLLVR